MPISRAMRDDLLLVHADEGPQHRQRGQRPRVTASAAMVWLATWPRHSPVTRAPQPSLAGPAHPRDDAS